MLDIVLLVNFSRLLGQKKYLYSKENYLEAANISWHT